jgi:hypothetical protein
MVDKTLRRLSVVKQFALLELTLAVCPNNPLLSRLVDSLKIGEQFNGEKRKKNGLNSSFF